jgi:hypothetical protein
LTPSQDLSDRPSTSNPYLRQDPSLSKLTGQPKPYKAQDLHLKQLQLSREIAHNSRLSDQNSKLDLAIGDIKKRIASHKKAHRLNQTAERVREKTRQLKILAAEISQQTESDFKALV